MHTQGTEYKTVEMALEPGLGVLMGASSHLRAGGGAATLHSLRPSPGYLALQSALPLPPPDSPPQSNQRGAQVSREIMQGGSWQDLRQTGDQRSFRQSCSVHLHGRLAHCLLTAAASRQHELRCTK